MDFFESTKVVFQRIAKLEPQNVTKIIGHLLLREDDPHLEMIRLAFCPDHALQTLVDKLNLELHLSPKPTTISPQLKISTSFTPFTQNGLWIPQMPISQQLVPLDWFDSAGVEYGLHHQFGSCYPMLEFRPPCLPEMGMQQVCNSFRQGYCKYGGSCKFLHVFQMQNGDCMVLNPTPPTPLKLLEVEIIQLLRSTRGIPVSVSSLPILYFDRYGKVLQVEGYQMENHRQGRFTSRMIQLLGRMTTTTIRLTNRPHRRQSIVLDEDMNTYAKFRLEKGHEVQVYLTFPPESIFSEQDVHNYFNNFGPVQEVRIPSQVHRMFGFVSFVYPETAALVLTKINPHYICGAQVLVKPYRFKPMLVERNNEEKVQDQIIYNADFVEAESKLISTARLEENTDLLGKRQTEEHEQSVELEREGVPSDYFTSEVTVFGTKTCKNDVERQVVRAMSLEMIRTSSCRV